jgi:hypothetical protein
MRSRLRVRKAHLRAGVAAKYKPSLERLLLFVHGREYHKNKVYTKRDSSAISTPTDVLRWMNLKKFGTPDLANDANPTECRSSSLEYWKKAISFLCRIG